MPKQGSHVNWSISKQLTGEFKPWGHSVLYRSTDFTKWLLVSNLIFIFCLWYVQILYKRNHIINFRSRPLSFSSVQKLNHL